MEEAGAVWWVGRGGMKAAHASHSQCWVSRRGTGEGLHAAGPSGTTAWPHCCVRFWAVLMPGRTGLVQVRAGAALQHTSSKRLAVPKEPAPSTTSRPSSLVHSWRRRASSSHSLCGPPLSSAGTTSSSTPWLFRARAEGSSASSSHRPGLAGGRAGCRSVAVAGACAQESRRGARQRPDLLTPGSPAAARQATAATVIGRHKRAVGGGGSLGGPAGRNRQGTAARGRLGGAGLSQAHLLIHQCKQRISWGLSLCGIWQKTESTHVGPAIPFRRQARTSHTHMGVRMLSEP